MNRSKTAISGTSDKEEDWTLDALGNWTGYVQKTNGSTDLNQARTFNAANETTQIDNSTTHVAHDAAGNMTKLPKPASWSAHYDLVFDAWNRLVSVADGGSTVAEYQYDARNYRVVKKTYSGGSLSETRHFYYDGSWQVVEERLESGGVISSNANRQYVWGLRYTDDLVLRDRDTTGNGTLDERLYALQDPNWNVVAIAGTNGAIQERYTYTAYGKPSFQDSTFAVRSPNVTSYVWDSLYTGRQYDPETGFYYYRNRFYSAELGRFPSRDPIGYNDGISLYQYVRSSPLSQLDPSGETCSATVVSSPVVGLSNYRHTCIQVEDDVNQSSTDECGNPITVTKHRVRSIELDVESAKRPGLLASGPVRIVKDFADAMGHPELANNPKLSWGIFISENPCALRQGSISFPLVPPNGTTPCDYSGQLYSQSLRIANLAANKSEYSLRSPVRTCNSLSWEIISRVWRRTNKP